MFNIYDSVLWLSSSEKEGGQLDLMSPFARFSPNKLYICNRPIVQDIPDKLTDQFLEHCQISPAKPGNISRIALYVVSDKHLFAYKLLMEARCLKLTEASCLHFSADTQADFFARAGAFRPPDAGDFVDCSDLKSVHALLVDAQSAGDYRKIIIPMIEKLRTVEAFLVKEHQFPDHFFTTKPDEDFLFHFPGNSKALYPDQKVAKLTFPFDEVAPSVQLPQISDQAKKLCDFIKAQRDFYPSLEARLISEFQTLPVTQESVPFFNSKTIPLQAKMEIIQGYDHATQQQLLKIIANADCASETKGLVYQSDIDSILRECGIENTFNAGRTNRLILTTDDLALGIDIIRSICSLNQISFNIQQLQGINFSTLKIPDGLNSSQWSAVEIAWGILDVLIRKREPKPYISCSEELVKLYIKQLTKPATLVLDGHGGGGTISIGVKHLRPVDLGKLTEALLVADEQNNIKHLILQSCNSGRLNPFTTDYFQKIKEEATGKQKLLILDQPQAEVPQSHSAFFTGGTKCLAEYVMDSIFTKRKQQHIGLTISESLINPSYILGEGNVGIKPKIMAQRSTWGKEEVLKEEVLLEQTPKRIMSLHTQLQELGELRELIVGLTPDTVGSVKSELQKITRNDKENNIITLVNLVLDNIEKNHPASGVLQLRAIKTVSFFWNANHPKLIKAIESGKYNKCTALSSPELADTQKALHLIDITINTVRSAIDKIARSATAAPPASESTSQVALSLFSTPAAAVSQNLEGSAVSKQGSEKKP